LLDFSCFYHKSDALMVIDAGRQYSQWVQDKIMQDEIKVLWTVFRMSLWSIRDFGDHTDFSNISSQAQK